MFGGGGGGHKLAPHHTNVCKFSQNCGALSSPQILLSNLVIILIFRHSNLSSTNGVDGFSLTGPCHKLKKPWKGRSPSNGLLWKGLLGQKGNFEKIFLFSCWKLFWGKHVFHTSFHKKSPIPGYIRAGQFFYVKINFARYKHETDFHL